MLGDDEEVNCESNLYYDISKQTNQLKNKGKTNNRKLIKKILHTVPVLIEEFALLELTVPTPSQREVETSETSFQNLSKKNVKLVHVDWFVKSNEVKDYCIHHLASFQTFEI